MYGGDRGVGVGRGGGETPDVTRARARARAKRDRGLAPGAFALAGRTQDDIMLSHVKAGSTHIDFL